MNMMKRVFVGLVLAVAVSVGVDAAKISVNLAEDNGGTAQTVLPTEAAGLKGYEAYNWNNFIQAKKNTSLALVDDSGAAIGSMINFKVSNGWGDGTADTTPNGKVARGYFDDGQTSTGIGVDIEVTNVTYPVYHVILLLSADSTDGNWGTFSVNGVSKTGGPKLRYNTVNGFFVGRNALLFEDVTGTTVNIHCPSRSGTTRGTIAGFQIVRSEKAHGATPATETKNVPLDQIVSWVAPAAYVPVSYTVYMDPNELLVANGNVLARVANNHTPTTLGPLTLKYDTKYFWRVDALEPNSPTPILHAGDMWSFTTVKHPSQINSGSTPAPGIVVLNPSFENVGDPGNNWGYDALDWFEEGDNQTGTGARAFWEVGTSIGMPNCDGTRWAGMDESVAYYQNVGTVTPGQNYVLKMLVGVRSGYGTPTGNRVTVSLYSGGSVANAADGVTLGTFATPIESYTFIPAELEAISAREFILNAPLSTGAATAGQTLWVHIKATTGRIYIDNVRVEEILGTNCAWNPSPARNATGVSVSTGVLSWNTGVDVNKDYQTDTSIVAHRVYAGADRNAVISADSSDVSGIYRGRLAVGTTSYNPVADGKPLPSDSTIYWRIDEELTGGAIVRGELWSFATELLLAEIITKPISAVVAAGETASYSVQVQSATPETYQWFKVVDGVDQAVQKPTANAATVVLDNVGLADEGLYRCRIHNNAGNIFTDTVFLVVKRKMGHWTFDGSLADQVNPAHQGSSLVSRYVEGISGQAWGFIGDPNVVVVENSAADFNFYTQGYSASAWIKTTQGGWGAYVAKQLKGTGIASKGFILTHDGGNAVTTLRQSFNDLGSANVTVNDGQWHHIVGTYDAVRGLGRIYVDGKLNNTSGVNMTALTGTDQPLYFGAETVAGDVAFVGSLDDVQIWNYALDGYEVATVFTDIRTDQMICVEIDPMDFDGSCRVDLADFALFAAKWLDCNRIPAGDCTQ